MPGDFHYSISAGDAMGLLDAEKPTPEDQYDAWAVRDREQEDFLTGVFTQADAATAGGLGTLDANGHVPDSQLAGGVPGAGKAPVHDGTSAQWTDIATQAELNAAVALKSNVLRVINAQVGANYAFVLGDADNVVTVTNAGGPAVTVPTNAAVAFAIGTEIDLINVGAVAATIAGAVGVTVNGTAGLAQYERARLIKLGTNLWNCNRLVAT